MDRVNVYSEALRPKRSNIVLLREPLKGFGFTTNVTLTSNEAEREDGNSTIGAKVDTTKIER